MTTAAWLILSEGKYDIIQHILIGCRSEVHPVQVVCCHSKQWTALQHLTWQTFAALCQPWMRLHFAARGNLVVDTFYSDFRQQLFSVAAPKAWNELPDWLCNHKTVDSIKATLKIGMLTDYWLFDYRIFLSFLFSFSKNRYWKLH